MLQPLPLSVCRSATCPRFIQNRKAVEIETSNFVETRPRTLYSRPNQESKFDVKVKGQGQGTTSSCKIITSSLFCFHSHGLTFPSIPASFTPDVNLIRSTNPFLHCLVHYGQPFANCLGICSSPFAF